VRNPQQNGRHERMHLTLKLETTKPAARNFLQQQARFDDFIDCYNSERPHRRSTCSVLRSSTSRRHGPIADCRTSPTCVYRKPHPSVMP